MCSETTQDSVWFIRIEWEALELLTDDYGHCISSGPKHVAWKYLEKVWSKKQCCRKMFASLKTISFICLLIFKLIRMFTVFQILSIMKQLSMLNISIYFRFVIICNIKISVYSSIYWYYVQFTYCLMLKCSVLISSLYDINICLYFFLKFNIWKGNLNLPTFMQYNIHSLKYYILVSYILILINVQF